ncbi:MAG: exodeoxyribonuclease VII small subunit [Clostridia bacterium]|nr:exodeoxyribonuclease VII small subunit [Clostridia bacterium]
MANENNMSFEDTMKNLQEIVQELEKGTLNLEDSVKKFEEGIELSKKCNEILENAEKKINILIRKDEEIIEKPFTPTEE